MGGHYLARNIGNCKQKKYPIKYGTKGRQLTPNKISEFWRYFGLYKQSFQLVLDVQFIHDVLSILFVSCICQFCFISPNALLAASFATCVFLEMRGLTWILPLSFLSVWVCWNYLIVAFVWLSHQLYFYENVAFAYLYLLALACLCVYA